MSSGSMIAALAWVPAGVADPHPKKYELSAAEQELVQALQEDGGAVELAEQRLQTERDQKSKKINEHDGMGGLPADLRMDEYSDDDDETDERNAMAIGALMVGQGEFDVDHEEMNNDGESSDDGTDDDEEEDDLADVPDTREYMPIDVEGLQAMGLSQVGATAVAMGDYDEDDENDSDAEDVRLSANDAVVVIAKAEDDFASLEVLVYDQSTGGLYVHHDIPLPAFPLCLAHGQVAGSNVGNYCAVGTFTPGIEIWNLDVLNALEPTCVLGGENTTATDELLRLQVMSGNNNKNSKQRKSKVVGLATTGLRPGSHTEAVMSLSWNAVHKQVIASGSADCTVKLWDVTKAINAAVDTCNASTFTHHRDKVQSVVWHPNEGSLLATGSYDGTVAVLDARTNGKNVKSVKLPADCERVEWDPAHPEHLTVLSEDGTLTCWDVREFDTSTPLWSLVVNEMGGVTDFCYNARVPGLVATCSIDKTVTLWDAYNVTSQAPTRGVVPRSCGSKDMCSGKLYTCGFYPSTPWLLGSAGTQLALWDLSSEQAVQKRFGDRVTAAEAALDPASEAKADEFDAMMSAKVHAAAVAEKLAQKPNKKLKSKGKTNKVHRKGR